MTFRSGKLIIVLMFGFGIAAAALGMWYRYQTTRRSLELWGTQSALLVARAPEIKAIRFDPPAPGNLGMERAILESRPSESLDVTRARGAENVRVAFVEDSTFDWDQAVKPDGLAWRYALQFSDGDRSALLLFDPDARVIGSPATNRVVAIDPAASADLASFFEEQFKSPDRVD